MSLLARLLPGSALTAPLDESLDEGGIGGRIAGARRGFTLPPPSNATSGARDMVPQLVAKRKRELEQRQEVRDRMRMLAIESRRQLKTLGEAGRGGIAVGSRFKFPNEAGKLAHSVWEIDSLGGPGGKVILYRVGKGGKTLSAAQPGKNLTGVAADRFRKMVQVGDAVPV